ncbi:hypothetical protein JF531_09280 [Microbacterium esteraromaticum]|uniref:hypothetical protein n=1 Tax=Microbacterium esteraromaticum TaxID=57043 RepID=UPI001A907D3B|nr:hypothetical protein [Microbacterium esteraromaticum]MBN8424712.1 hypothetical protein [Microbacterium esteraromaticum]
MQDDVARQLIDQLVNLLPDVGLSVLVEQHRDAVDNGRIVEIESEDSGSRSRKTKLEKLLPGDVRRRDLTVAEQLSGLVDLMELAVVGTIEMEERTVEMAREFLPEDGDPTIRFSDDLEDVLEDDIPAPKTTSVDPVTVVTVPDRVRTSAARDVLDTLRELRDMAGVSRGEWLETQEDRLTSARTERVRK